MVSPVLVGDGVRLRPVEPADAAIRRRHGWHREIERGYGSDRADGPMSDDENRDWLEQIVRRDSPTFWALDATRDPGGRLAGVAFLHSVEQHDRSARFAIGLFHPRFMRRGLGMAATRLVLDHAFVDLGLHRVGLRVLASNSGAIAMYERAGFTVEGRERESCRVGDRWYDDVLMGVLATDHRAQGDDQRT